MNKLLNATLLALVMLTAGCAHPTPTEQKVFDILGCFSGTLSAEAEKFVGLLINDALAGTSPNWKQAADNAIATATPDALPDIVCAIDKAVGMAYNPASGSMVNGDYVKGIMARAAYLQAKTKLKLVVSH
jgi:hypothetical protein